MGKCDARLERAVLYYLRCFRKGFISEQRPSSGSLVPLGEPGGSVPKDKVLRSLRHRVDDASPCPVALVVTPYVFASVAAVWQALFERIGMGDQMVIVSNMIQKLSNNLRYWATNTEVIGQTLELFTDLTSFSSAKMVLTLEAINFVLTHHTVSGPPSLLRRCLRASCGCRSRVPRRRCAVGALCLPERSQQRSLPHHVLRVTVAPRVFRGGL
jgi:hypothetical protein